MSDMNVFDLAAISPGVCVANNLRKIARTVVQAYEDALRPSGITISQFSTLGTLNETGPLSILNLAEAMDIDRTTLARNLKPLARDGLIQIVPDENDGRVKVVHVTALGNAVLERAAPLWYAVQQHFVTGLGEAELGNLTQTFAKLRHLAQSE